MTQLKDWLAIPVSGDARIMIDASAGTGKTFTIALAYLRLLLEGAEPRRRPSQILVSTFTVAAAAELRARIRLRINEAINYRLEPDGAASSDPLLQWLDQRWANLPDVQAADIRHLRICWSEMDAAPISTLHSLCGKILADNPVLTGNGYEPVKVIDLDELLDKSINDVWRDMQSDLKLSKQLEMLGLHQRADLADQLKGYLSPRRELAVPQAFNEANYGLNWQRDLERLSAVLNEHRESLNKAALGLLDMLDAGLAGLPESDLFVLSNENDALKIEDGYKGLFYAKVTKVEPEPEGVGAEYWHLAGYVSRRNRILFLARTLERVKARIEFYKNSMRVQTFDDVLRRVHDALHDGSANARALADRLFTIWPVALIDEFQDTDATQFGILDTIYRDAENATRGLLLMIGDPKQAIYQFRGGDIHVFATASKQADHHLTLNSNFRSSAQVIAGLNAFHARYGNTFEVVTPEIEFTFASIDDPKSDQRQPGVHAGLHLWTVGGDKSKSGTERDCVRASAQHIVGLLNTNAAGDGQPVTPDDIAILVSRHVDAVAMQNALRDCGVGSVIGKGSDVFESTWALELQLLVASAIDPSNVRKARAVLLSRLYSLTVSDLRQGDQALQELVARMPSQWAEWFTVGGVLGLVERTLRDRHVDLSGRADYERMRTDLRQLAELMQEQQIAGVSPQLLVPWLQQQKDVTADQESSERSRRMESEGGKVQIMTIWASKGLEFPIVYVPLGWARNLTNYNKLKGAVHRDADSGLERPPFTKDESTHYLRRTLEEDLRLLYVAMTRAKRECHLFVRVGNEHNSAVEWRMKHDAGDDESSTSMVVHPGLPTNTSTSVRYIAAKHSDVTTIPFAEPDKPESVRWIQRLDSYSGLARRMPHALPSVIEHSPAADESLAADDSGGAEPIAAPLRSGLWGVASAAFGDVLHKAMELIMQNPAAADVDETLRRAMQFQGFTVPKTRDPSFGEPQFFAAVVELVNRCLDVPLLAGEALTLRQLHSASIRREMNFDMAVKSDIQARKQLNALAVAAAGTDRAADWSLVQSLVGEHRFDGFMTGSMDLVFEHDGKFYVLDYKSNVLGRTPQSFTPQEIDRQAMRNGANYWLQALIYTVALHRFLKVRLGAAYAPEQHLGGAVYLFMRGVGLEGAGPGGGIWFDKFDVDMIEAVDAIL